MPCAAYTETDALAMHAANAHWRRNPDARGAGLEVMGRKIRFEIRRLSMKRSSRNENGPAMLGHAAARPHGPNGMVMAQ
jgi:hypothetical protein